MASSQVPSTDQNAASMGPSSPVSTVQSAIATAAASIATPPTRTGTPGTGIASGTTTTAAAGAGVVSPSINVTQTYPSSFGSITSIANYPTQAINSFETYKKKDSAKIVVRFKAIGNAPIMRNNHFRITAFNRFQAVIQFLRKELGWKQGDALFLYINSSFSPAPDDTVGNLFRCFGTEGHLIVNYSTQAAWG